MRRTLLLSASVRPWLIPRRIASRIPSRCLRIVLPSLTNGASRQRARRERSRSISTVTSSMLRPDSKMPRTASLSVPHLAAGGLQAGEGDRLRVGELLGLLEQRPARVLEALGGVLVAERAQF